MDRDQVAMKHISVIDKLHSVDNVPRNHIKNSNSEGTHNKLNDPNAEYDIALCMVPAWGVFFPPYNIAKLTGHLRKNNFKVYVNDINIKAYCAVQNTDNADAFDGDKYWKWMDEQMFYDNVFPDLEELFEEQASIISNLKTNIVGFTVYNTNVPSVRWFINYLKFHVPEKIIILGGPQIYYNVPKWGGDYIFKGEAEESLVNFLNSNPKKLEKQEVIGSWYGKDDKLDLGNIGWPDYKDYDFSLYQHTNGISSEVSRGCVAKCSFCTETRFWRYRYRDPLDVVNEIEEQKKLINLTRVWFVDSLVNGNVKQLEQIAKNFIKKNINISWNGYARCNNRMNKEYFQTLVDSGCSGLSFGVESGSNKVLKVMNKKITVDWIYNNIKDASVVRRKDGLKIDSHINWMVGYPQEHKIDQLQSFALLYNIRTYADGISPGATTGQATGAYLGDKPEDYNISTDIKLYDSWITNDFKVTKPHRLIRLICTVTLLDLMMKYLPDNILHNHQHRQELDDKWSFEYDNFFNIHYIDIDKDINLEFLNEETNSNINWSNALTNEWITFFYFLNLIFGNYKFSYKLSKQEINDAFGLYIAVPYAMDINVEVNNKKLKIDINHLLDSDPSYIQTKYQRSCNSFFNIFDTKNSYEFKC